jgi:hypothetical protein
MKVLLYGLGVMLVLVSTVGSAYAGRFDTVPEIGGDAIAAGLGVLSAGILVLRARRRK